MIRLPLAPGEAALAADVIALVAALSAAGGHVGHAAEALRASGVIPSPSDAAARRVLDRQIAAIPGMRAWLSDAYPRGERVKLGKRSQPG